MVKESYSHDNYLNPHKTTRVLINGKEIAIDEKIVELVESLNKCGLETLASCHGNKNDVAWITISMRNVKEVIHTGDSFIIVWDNAKLHEEE